MFCLRTIMAKVILGEPLCILQYNTCDEIIANVLDFILEEVCDFRVTAQTYRLACLTLVSHYEIITTMSCGPCESVETLNHCHKLCGPS